MSDTSLVFVVPSDLITEGCERTVDLIVWNDDGDAPAIALRILRPMPTLDHDVPTTIVAGTETTWKGQALANATATSTAATLSSRSAYDRIAIAVPRSAVVGTAEIRVNTECGSVSAQVEIRARVPEIVSVDLPTVGHNGVLFIKADFGKRTSVRGVRLGATLVPTDDARYFAWPSAEAHELANVMAVRIPAQQPPVSFELSVVGVTGESAAKSVRFIELTNEVHPPPAEDILFVVPDRRFASYRPDTTDAFGVLPADDSAPARSGYRQWYFETNDDEDAGVLLCSECSRYLAAIGAILIAVSEGG
jgi:hypothetical protein